MDVRRQMQCLLWTGLAGVASLAQAESGLVAGSNEWLWPQVQARITLQTAALTPVSLARGAESTAATRAVFGGAVLGDYVFASPGFGSFRATSGLMLGAPGGALLSQFAPMSRLSVATMDMGALPASGGDGLPAAPYLGLGFSTPLAWRSLSLTADLGLTAARPASVTGFGRALLGSQPLDSAWREMRISPMLQMGMRYSF